MLSSSQSITFYLWAKNVVDEGEEFWSGEWEIEEVAVLWG